MAPRTALLSDDVKVFALGDAWRELWQRTPGTTPFVSPDWLLPWWRQFGTGQPRVSALWDGERLAGVLPLYVLPAAGKVLPMGVGISDYFDALIDPGASPDAASTLLAGALSGADGLDCNIPELPPDSHLLSATAPGWSARIEDGSPCPVLDGAVPARQQRNLRVAQHRAERRGGCRVRMARADTLHEALDTLFALHARRWQDGGVLSDPRVRAFHREAAPALHSAGLLQLMALEIASRPAASVYTLRTPDTLMYYLGGYDTAFAHESPGTILIGAMIDAARAEGIERIDFLRGAEPYKYAWGATDRLNRLLRLSRDGR